MIEALISSKTRIKLLLKFFLNSKNTAYLRNLEDEFGESTNAIRVELNRFEEAGFLTSSAEGNKKIFTVNTKHPFFPDINKILMKMTGLEYVVDYVLQRIGELDKVFLVGNLARGKNTDIIDLVLVGDSLGMVVQGRDSTLPVSVDDIVYHTACVARGLSKSDGVVSSVRLPRTSPSEPRCFFQRSSSLTPSALGGPAWFNKSTTGLPMNDSTSISIGT